MSRPYIGQDVIDQCRDLIRQGHRLEDLAARIGISPEDLLMLLYGRQPSWKPIPDSDDVDLWRADELEDVL